MTLTQLQNGWQINDTKHLFKQYIFSNFIDAMNFANKIATLSEQEKHHPKLTISWGLCEIEIWTHKTNKLTEKDFILANKIEDIY